MANKNGKSVANALDRGGYEKDKCNSNGWTNPTTGQKLEATNNYIKKGGNTGYTNVSNRNTIR